MLAWATEAAQVDIGHGVVIAFVAFVAILPEYVVELHYAFTGQAEYVTANLTGASRLLLGCAVGLPAVVALLRGRWGVAQPEHLSLPSAHRLELAILGLGSVWAIRGVMRGELTLLDSAVLVSLYVLYVRRVAAIGDEAPRVVGVAAQLAGVADGAAQALGARAHGCSRRRRSSSPRCRSATRCSAPARSSASSPTCCCSGSSRSPPRRPSWSSRSCC